MGQPDDPNKNELNPGESPSEEFEFLQETIKEEKGIGLKKGAILKYAILGLIFGLAASCGFFAIKPWTEGIVIRPASPVEIPKEEPEEEPGESKEPEDPEESAEPVEPPVFEMPELTIDNYRELSKALYDMGNETAKCVAEVRSTKKKEEWQDTDYDKTNSISGIIVADNGQEYLVFGSSQVAKSSDKVRVKFADGRTYRGRVKCKDENLGFAVYAIQKNNVSESTKSRIAIATLGMSGTIVRGETVIALGSPFGYPDAMGFGIVASPKNSVMMADGEYRLVCTDISGSKNGTGALVNTKGEVVGMIDQRVAGEDNVNLVTAYGISDLKQMIELLSNGENVPYLGIHGITVTENTAEEQGIPRGVYVQSVDADSPAMEAGIQSGDVITGMGDETISTLSIYHTQLMNLKVDEEAVVQGMRKGKDGYVDITFNIAAGSCE